MKTIFIATYGSRGDVQPYVALGQGLKAAGYRVVLGTSERFREFVESCGLEYGYMNDGLLDLLDTDQGRDVLENTRNIFQVVKHNINLKKQVKPLQTALMKETWEIAARVRPDFIVYHPKAAGGPHIAEKLGIGCALATPFPMVVPTAQRPFFILPDLKLGRWYNRLGYRLINALTGIFWGAYIRELRRDLGLPPLKRFDLLKTAVGEDIPVLHAIGSPVFPRPSDWPANAWVTGYWFLDRENDWEPPQVLENFLRNGEPPVYIGFGSMAGRNPRRLADIVVDALERAGVRGILATGWGGVAPGDLPETILKIDGAPHDWLFPRVSAVVHHGGAGTTAAGLRAGRPALIVPFFGDQPFWGQQVHRLGAGPAPIPLKKLTAGGLAAAIEQAVSDSRMAARARDIGRKLRREDGIATAVAIVEKIMDGIN